MKQQHLFLGILAILALIVIGNAILNPQANNGGTQTQLECSTDSDCVAAGCSGQICAPASKAHEIITTCEFRPEYACLRTEATCSCVQNKCDWKKSPNFSRCVAEARTKYGAEAVG